MEGRRVYLNNIDDILTFEKGDYGVYEGEWWVYPPSNINGAASIRNHKVVENLDKTITVSPSILISDGENTWHGYLRNGIWSEA